MYLMISNISLSCDAFFRAIPYSGPQITLTGHQPYDTVSNTISIQAAIADLSGVTNEQFYMTLDGYPLRYSLGPGNTITIDTRYDNAGSVNLYANAFNTARVFDPANPPDKAKLSFSTSAQLPLDFENDTYMAFASDMCSPDVGTNYFLFVVNKAQNVSAMITDPSNGQTVAIYSGYVPNPATVEIPWNFTEADGVTPYSNDTYVVSFTASDPLTLVVTNTVDRVGVRIGAGTFMTYQWEDPGDPTGEGQWLDDQADTWIKATLAYLYNDLYDQSGLTQYYSYMVGANRNRGDCYPRDSYSIDWDHILNYLTNTVYSELTLGPAHGSGAEIGGGQGDFLPGTFSPLDLKRYVLGTKNKNWRLRKANLWTCYSGNIYLATGGYYTTYWADACGIRPKGLQENTYMRKNCGVFLGGEINQRGFAGGDSSISCAKVVELCDQVWVCGKYMYPGGCDPTYSFEFAVNATRGVFNPELDQADPLLYGYKYMIYASVYDDLLMVGNTVFVHTQ